MGGCRQSSPTMHLCIDLVVFVVAGLLASLVPTAVVMTYRSRPTIAGPESKRIGIGVSELTFKLPVRIDCCCSLSALPSLRGLVG